MSQDQSPHENPFDQQFWDERYGGSEDVWSGAPNPLLVERASGLTPGTALEVGSGEGADAIWLASRGWQVTALDLSPVGLARAASRAAALGADVADNITWQQADLLEWKPSTQRFDLVTAQFMHLPRAALEVLHRQLAAVVAPGGSLLVVGHHPADHDGSAHRPDRDLFFTAEQVAAVLDDCWEILLAGAPERQALNREGQLATVRDAVLHAVRRR